MVPRIQFSNMTIFSQGRDRGNACKSYISATTSFLFIFDIFLNYEITLELAKIFFIVFLKFLSKILCQ